MISSTNSI